MGRESEEGREVSLFVMASLVCLSGSFLASPCAFLFSNLKISYMVAKWRILYCDVIGRVCLIDVLAHARLLCFPLTPSDVDDLGRPVASDFVDLVDRCSL